jgi:hypothetical protein
MLFIFLKEDLDGNMCEAGRGGHNPPTHLYVENLNVKVLG